MFPQTAAEWSDLPGVGSYTAAALASIAGGQAVAAVDGNVKRVLARLFGIEQSIDTPATQREIWRLADTLLARRSPGEFNQALMELGARMCVPRAPDCEHCPIARWCTARSAGTQCELPRRGARRPPRRVHAVAAVVWRRGRILLVRRAHGRLLAGMWTLPGTDVENGVAPQAALVSALDSLGLSIAMGRTLGTVQHEFTHRSLRVHVFACHLQRGIRAQTPEAQWFSCSELETVPLASLDRKLLALAQPPRAEAGS
jgi:A/G-specific adenine glycosylase